MKNNLKSCYNCGTPIIKEYCENYPETCGHWTPKKPQTNYEKIKNMSVEDMAAFMYDENENNYNYCDYCQHQRARAPHCVSINIQEDCIKARVNWLKAAAEESGAK